MFKSFGQEFKVGLFAIVAFAALGYMFVILSDGVFSDREYKKYYTILSKAAGIVEKTHVKTNGVSIGKVSTIDLADDSTRVEFEVDTRVMIPKGSKIEIRSTGLLGDVHLEIIRAAASGDLVEEGGHIEEDEGGSGLMALVAKGGQIADDVKKITKVLSSVLGSRDGETKLSEILKNIQE